MKKLTPTIHFAWALLPAGAWWLGTHHGGQGTGAAEESRIGFTAAAAPSGNIALHPDAAVRPVLDKQAETLTWVNSWRGADGRISPERMAEAVKDAQNDNPLRGLNRFLQLLESLTAENAPAALQALKSNPGPDTESWVNLLCTAWGGQDGAAAMDSLTNSGERGAAMAGWARSNPAAAQLWLYAQVSPGIAEAIEWCGLEQSYVRGMAQRDSAAALAYISAQSEDRRGNLVWALTGEQLTHGAHAAAQWAAELPDSAMRGAALEIVAREYMEVDPGAGAAWGAEISSAPDTRQAVARVADRMAETDVRAAFAWTLQLPTSPGQEEAFQQVFSEWARQDPGASSEELRSMTPGPERDNAIHAFSRILVNESPGDAIVWATAIANPAMRLETQIDVARTWNAASPAEAQTWITTHLPSTAQDQVLAGE